MKWGVELEKHHPPRLDFFFLFESWREDRVPLKQVQSMPAHSANLLVLPMRCLRMRLALDNTEWISENFRGELGPAASRRNYILESNRF